MDTAKIVKAIEEAIAERYPIVQRRIWLPDFECDPVQVVSDDPWPVVVLVTRWDVNDLGERRYVESRQYVPAKDR